MAHDGINTDITLTGYLDILLYVPMINVVVRGCQSKKAEHVEFMSKV
jgi:hypothetical protein